MDLTRSELEIMDVLWDSRSPLSRADLLERSEEKYVLMDSSKFFLSSIVSYSRRVSPDKILTEAYPDQSYPETQDLKIEILACDK